MLKHRIALVGALMTASACSKEQAQDAVDDAKARTQEALEKGSDRAEEELSEAKDAATERAKEELDAAKDKATQTAKDKAQQWKEDLVPDKGEIGEFALGLLDKGTDPDTIESVVAKGKQIAPVAMDIGATLAEGYDKQVRFVPIYQTIDEQSEEGAQTPSEVDELIGDMPRTETIDGLTVGFKQLKSTDAAERKDVSSYLVLWRKKDKLVGFIYHSERTLDLEHLIAQAPRLISLVEATL